MNENQESSWLIRDTSNHIRGPFRQAEIVAMVKKGQLKGKMEISRANSYWFSIEEKVELARFFPEFNHGQPVPEAPTQMTATLTQAEIEENQVDITTFTAAPSKLEMGSKPEEANATQPQMEWLSEEFAEEFGADFGTTVASPAELSSISLLGDQGSSAPENPQQPTPPQEKSKSDMLKRATVKADTLPSEHKSFQGDRPKPIDAMLRVPGKTVSPPAPQSAMISVPVEESPTARIIRDEDTQTNLLVLKRKKNIAIAIGLVLVAILVGVFIFSKTRSARVSQDVPGRTKRLDPVADLRRALLFFDLESAKGVLADMELDPSLKSDSSTFLAQALVKKEFLYDTEGALLALDMAKQRAKNKRAESEVENLIAIYGFDRDNANSLESLKRNSEAFPDDSVFRYNYALGLLRSKKEVEAVGVLDSLLVPGAIDMELQEDVALGIGWALDAHCSVANREAICRRSSEEAYQKALEANPNSAKARLGLGLFRLRKGGVKSAETDFKAFLDMAAELEYPNRVVNFRKLSNQDFYSFVHSQIVELESTSQSLKVQQPPVIMAVDGVVSCILGRNSEAGKILEGALSNAPGDVSILKAFGYLRWREGQMNELVETLKDLRERGSFALNLMLGKAYWKLRKKEFAEKYAKALIEFSDRSEGMALSGELLMDLPEKQQEAKAAFQSALKIDPLDLTALRGMQRISPQAAIQPDLLKKLPF